MAEHTTNGVSEVQHGQMIRRSTQRVHSGNASAATEYAACSVGSVWASRLQRDDKGRLLRNLTNTEIALSQSPDWQGAIAYDEFADRVVFRRRPSWSNGKAGDVWNDNAEFHAQKWFENLPEEARFTPAAKTIARTIQAVARQHAYHPVRDYLGGLRWDGNARLERWLTTYLKAPDTPYTRAVGARWLISAVARVYKPGCQADYMLVLEGKQGRQKSKALRSLCPDVTWFTDYMPNHANKDAAMQCKGAWIIEDAELRATKTSQQDASKSFHTRRVDKFRPPYGKYTIQLPRHCVMAGTVNPPSDGRYLKDSTGNRRYWPVAVADNIDVENLERDRDELWAEAVKRYRERMPWWLETAELEAMAEAEQAKRIAINEFHDEVISWLEALPLTGKNLPNQSDVSVTECLNGIFGQERHHSRSDEIKVANILKNNGYRRYRPNRDGLPRTPRYRKSHAASP